MNLVSDARATEAELQLKHLHMLQERYRMKNAKYGSTLEEIGFEQEKLADEGGSAHYRIEIIEASNNTFTAKAEAQTDFDGDGDMNVWEIDQDKNLKEITKD